VLGKKKESDLSNHKVGWERDLMGAGNSRSADRLKGKEEIQKIRNTSTRKA